MRFKYSTTDPSQDEFDSLPRLPLMLRHNNRQIEVVGLVDSGANELLSGVRDLLLSPYARIRGQAHIIVVQLDGPLPPKAVEDALHIAVATTNGMDYLLTWNFKHMANATIRTQIEHYCRSSGYEPPIICTPQELLEE